MAQPPNLLIASRAEIAQRFIDKARRLERTGDPHAADDAEIYRKIGRNLRKVRAR